MNFAYNFITNLNRLKGALLAQFDNMPLEVQRHHFSDTEKEERFFVAGTDKQVCSIAYNEQGITYYEPKKKENS